jgi:SAM-dependent methyltransferase
MTPPEIFSRSVRRQFRERASRSLRDDQWIVDQMSDELIERLDLVHNCFERALIIGCVGGKMRAELERRGSIVFSADAGHIQTSGGRGVQCDEDRLPFADGSFDLVLSVGTLDSVNDLPGALRLICRALRPEGLFLGAMLGAGTLETLKTLLSAPRHDDPCVVRYHPQIDVRAAGDLLARAGFDLPVADCATVTARYANLPTLVADLRANGLGNALIERHPMRRQDMADLILRFAPSPEAKTEERFSFIFLTGWTPSLI